MIVIKEIKINGKKLLGIEIHNLGNAPLIIVKGSKGYAMCGYLNMDVADKLGDVAIIISGVKSVEEMLKKQVRRVSKKALELGISEGMLGEEALEKLA